MPLFIDPQARVRLDFPADSSIDELRGEWIEVRESISDAQWQELQAGVLMAAAGQAPGGAVDWHMAFSGENGLRRMAMWIEGVSFLDASGRRYPNGNVADRMRWLGAMWPPAADAVRTLLDEYVGQAWTVAQPEPHPKAARSSGQTRKGSQKSQTDESPDSGDTST